MDFHEILCGGLKKICQIPDLVTIGQQYQALYMTRYVCFVGTGDVDFP
jgi:hypothetical protein